MVAKEALDVARDFSLDFETFFYYLIVTLQEPFHSRTEATPKSGLVRPLQIFSKGSYPRANRHKLMVFSPALLTFFPLLLDTASHFYRSYKDCSRCTRQLSFPLHLFFTLSLLQQYKFSLKQISKFHKNKNLTK